MTTTFLVDTYDLNTGEVGNPVLPDHTPTSALGVNGTGSGYTEYGGSYVNAAKVNVANEAERGSFLNRSVSLLDDAPGSADIDLYGIGRARSAAGWMYFVLRADTGSGDCYVAGLDGTAGRWRIRKYNFLTGQYGTYTDISETPSGGVVWTYPGSYTNYTVRAVARGSSLELLVNGVSTVTATDSSLSAAGLAGVFLGGSSATGLGMCLQSITGTWETVTSNNGALFRVLLSGD